MPTKKIPSIWDYNVKNINLSKPEIACWYLKRRIEYGDWQGLEYQLLKKHLPQLDIEPGIKEILTDFVQTYEKKHFK